MVAPTSSPPAAPSGPIAGFLSRVSTYCAQTQRRETAVSRALFGDSRRIGELRGGASDVGVRRLAEAEAELARLADEAGVTLPEGAPAAESQSESLRPRAVGE